MIYKAIDCKTDKVLATASTRFELNEIMTYEIQAEKGSWHFISLPTCRECGDEEVEQMYDYYGIPTGAWCDSCYKSKYPYRKDAYDPYNEEGTR